jgi:drug/metabolite transporter (DMT)-like permease
MRRQGKTKLVHRLSIPLMLFAGTCATVVQKFMLEQRTMGRSIYPVHNFGKPWFLTLVMFVAEVLALVFYQISLRLKANSPDSAMYTDLVEGNDSPVTASRTPPSRLRLYLTLGLPALCDLVGSALMGIGLLYIDASIWQMLRGALTIFSALLHAFVLKRKQRSCMWAGVILVTVSLVIVGFAAVTSSHGVANEGVTMGEVIVAICLTVGAQFLRAVQVILEDYLVHDIEVSPYLIVGAEGIWGVIGTAFVFLPIIQHLGSLSPEGKGVHEDTIDTFMMMGNEPILIGLTFLYIFSILGLNVFGMILTEITNAVMRTIIESMRTLCIWVVQLIIHYALLGSTYGRHHPDIGEEWTAASWMELSGFLLLVTGMFVYNGTVKLFFLKYDENEERPATRFPDASDATQSPA